VLLVLQASLDSKVLKDHQVLLVGKEPKAE
jgi:hypothetical protein